MFPLINEDEALMTSPVISCLIPIYNGENYLELALDSISKQSFVDFEIIAVNDGSTDRSLELLQDFAARDPRIRIFSKPNGGIVAALNYGLGYCSGRLVARMDSDDIALPDRFAIQLAAFSSHPDAVAVGGLIQGIDEFGAATSEPTSPSRVEKTDLSLFPPAVANVQHSAGTFLKSAMEAVGGYRAGFPHAEDYDLYLRLAQHGNFYNPRKLVLYYRAHSNSLSRQNLERQETSAVLAELSALARKHGVTDPGDAAVALGVDDYVKALGAIGPDEQTVRRYIAFRIWRRSRGADEPRYRRSVIAGLLAPRNHRTIFDRSLNRRIVLSMGRKLLRITRNNPMRLLGRGRTMKLAQ
jgi:glycosyltransferase involved in cell wall biosynthesis